MNLYNSEFYKNRHRNTLNAAETILTIVQRAVPEVKSAVDLGCGVGTWLYALEQRGIKDVCGVDGKWVNKSYLKIQKECFVEHDFGKDPDPGIGRTFDLAISLEVAEHLPSTSAKGFIAMLTSLSDYVLFSAAIPGQTGKGHINEQWPGYWISLFENRGFTGFDCIRKSIWNDKMIPFWYRQNILLFVKNERIMDLKFECSSNNHIPPEVYLLSFKRVTDPPGIKQSLKVLFQAFGRRTRKLWE